MNALYLNPVVFERQYIAREYGRQKLSKPVSYTHLTLPTICSV